MSAPRYAPAEWHEPPAVVRLMRRGWPAQAAATVCRYQLPQVAAIAEQDQQAARRTPRNRIVR